MPQWRQMRVGRSRQAIIDIAACGHTTLRSRMIDVTIRQPMSDVYAPRASRVAGVSLETAERKKRERYSAVAGLSCTLAAMESFGRLGPQFLQLIGELSGAASEERQSRGLLARGPRRRWLAELSECLAVQTSEAVLTCGSERVVRCTGGQQQ